MKRMYSIKTEYRCVVQLFEAMRRCHYRSRVGERRRGFTIVGTPGAGKTPLAMTYRNHFEKGRKQ
jgi:DNA replication protein DnaC